MHAGRSFVGIALIAAVTVLGGSVEKAPTPDVRLAQATLWTTEELTGFQSPSRNIGCYIDPTMVRCDIAEREWAPPPRPGDCDPHVDYGQGLTLTPSAGSGLVCAGDTALGYGEVLSYGSAIRSGSLQCEMNDSAMVCRDLQTEHGFSLSRERYDLF